MMGTFGIAALSWCKRLQPVLAVEWNNCSRSSGECFFAIKISPSLSVLAPSWFGKEYFISLFLFFFFPFAPVVLFFDWKGDSEEALRDGICLIWWSDPIRWLKQVFPTLCSILLHFIAAMEGEKSCFSSCQTLRWRSLLIVVQSSGAKGVKCHW